MAERTEGGELVQLNVRVSRAVKRRLKLVTVTQDTTTQAFAAAAIEMALAAAEKRAA